MNDLYWIGPALISGLLAVRFGLPPLVGYLTASRSRQGDPQPSCSRAYLRRGQYPEEVATLKAVGVETTWDLYAEAGKGFAEEVIDRLGDTIEKTITPTAPSTPRKSQRAHEDTGFRFLNPHP
jgi:hypothetical protein